MRQIFLQTVPFFPLLFGVIEWRGTLIEQRKHVVKSNALDLVSGGLFVVSFSVLLLLIWPWANVGNRSRYAMYAGIAALVAHTVAAMTRAYRAGKLLPERSGAWVTSASLFLMSLFCLFGMGHVLLAPFPNDEISLAFPLEGDSSIGQGGPSILTNAQSPLRQPEVCSQPGDGRAGRKMLQGRWPAA